MAVAVQSAPGSLLVGWEEEETLEEMTQVIIRAVVGLSSTPTP
jgi:hypothetical protein